MAKHNERHIIVRKIAVGTCLLSRHLHFPVNRPRTPSAPTTSFEAIFKRRCNTLVENDPSLQRESTIWPPYTT